VIYGNLQWIQLRLKLSFLVWRKSVKIKASRLKDKILKVFCSPSEDSAIKAVSSAYKIRKSFRYICIDSSQRFVMLHNGSTLFSSKKDSKSFKNKEKKKRDTFSPCLTPVCDIKYSFLTRKKVVLYFCRF
jgi:hypothetical protein